MKKSLLYRSFLFLCALLPLAGQIMGDTDANGRVNIIDALMIAQYSVGLNPTDFRVETADVDCSGSITIVDALQVVQFSVGLLESFPCPAATATPGIPWATPEGFASLNGGTTGGKGGQEVYVSTGTALQAAIKAGNPRIIYVTGRIDPGNSGGLNKIDIKDVANLSIIGTGSRGELNGIGIKIWRASNIIIRNLRIHHSDIGDKDCIGIEGPSHNIWVDHCELYNDLNHDKDYYDGLFDVKRDSDYITFSWNIMYDSYKTSLVGSSDSDDWDRKITYHHNWIRNCFSRLPSYRFGTGHIYNNYYQDVLDTGINVRQGAVLRIENNYFQDCRNPLGYWFSASTGYWDVRDNIYNGCTGSQPTRSTGSFTPPYNYEPDPTDSVPGIVKKYAGVGVID